MNDKNLVTVELSLIKMIKDLRDEQKRFFQLTVDAKKTNLAPLWAERKKCLETCRQLEGAVDQHLDNILSGHGLPADQALELMKAQLGLFSGETRKEVHHG